MATENVSMDPAIKAEWVAALRSGDYARGRTYLREGDLFCCLGVLCERAVTAGVATRVPRSGGSRVFRYLDLDDTGNAYVLPLGVARWAGLTAVEDGGEYELTDPSVPTSAAPETRAAELGQPTISLTALNDYESLTFAQIADVIDAAL